MVNTSNEKSTIKRIEDILEKRKPLRKVIDGIATDLSSLRSGLSKLNAQKIEFLKRLGEYESENLSAINIENILERVEAESIEISKLKSRFDRDTLNIGVAGRARQGKSRFLRSLTGLSSSVIPDGSGGHCTAVKSTIYHKEGVSPSAIIDFHTENSLINEVLSPYYEELKLGQTPTSLGDFRQNFESVSPRNVVPTALNKAKWNHLNANYFRNFDEYKDLIGSGRSDKVTEEVIRSYVAKESEDGKSLFNYLAVKNVGIYCSFKNKDVGRIALVDMPGLGDTGVGSENSMMRSLSYGVDFVLFIRKPVAKGDDWMDYDFALHTVAENAMKERLPIEKWSFMILNKEEAHDGNGYVNEENCRRFKEKIKEVPINIADVIIANCANSDEANNIVLNRVLTYLAGNIQKLDKEYIQSCEAGLRDLQKGVNIFIAKAKNILQEDLDGHDYFTDEIGKVLKDLANGLEDLRKEAKANYDSEHIEFKQYVERVIQKTRDTAISELIQEGDLNSIKEKAQSLEGGDAYTAVYKGYYLPTLRSQLARDYLAIDKELHENILSFKNGLADALKDIGRLENLSNSSGIDFIEDLLQLIGGDTNSNKKVSDLHLGVMYLRNFDVSYAGIVQRLIREILDKLEPDEDDFDISNFISGSDNGAISRKAVNKVLEYLL